MSEIKTLAAPKASFDRRAVVKGAAWSVPVIAAAIAAPAAAASELKATAAFTSATGKIKYHLRGSEGSPSNNKNGNGPTGFSIKNSVTGSITGAISGTIIITPSTGGPDLSVYTLTSAGLPIALFADSDNTTGYRASFLTNSTTIAPNGSLAFAMAFNFAASTPNGTGSMTILLKFPGGRVLTLGPTTLSLG
ncbi:hypothetical protein J2X01_002492 [Arthrobacter ginsengisoli]|uniref:Uncharacterized protein n=1 Tax=Arthrobacter ginsengisoli TaxID=1356565 RepID=A0ABU1UDC3_9MICC|nr:hypothetical protein [Arthrobacter ginsengisoli]MDR7083199.1 hypothetical protein [Arthrobacter ginsengisoli]